MINFYKAVIYPSNDEIDIDIELKNKAGESYDSDTQIFVVVYGVAGAQNDVDVRLWDRYFYINNNDEIPFEAPINMGNKAIVGLKSGQDVTGAVNYQQLLNHINSSKNRTVSILGKIQIIKTFAIPKLLFRASVIRCQMIL